MIKYLCKAMLSKAYCTSIMIVAKVTTPRCKVVFLFWYIIILRLPTIPGNTNVFYVSIS